MRASALFLFYAKNARSFMDGYIRNLKGEIYMLKKIKKFMDTPITWGTSFKATAIVTAIWGGIIAIVLFWNRIVAFAEWVASPFKKLFKRR